MSAFLASLLKPRQPLFLCTDINPLAASATLRTGNQNGSILSPILTSLHYPLAQRLPNKVDILLFNPPYVSTVDEEEEVGQAGAGITASWAGGLDGMTSTKLLLESVPVSHPSHRLIHGVDSASRLFCRLLVASIS